MKKLLKSRVPSVKPKQLTLTQQVFNLNARIIKDVYNIREDALFTKLAQLRHLDEIRANIDRLIFIAAILSIGLFMTASYIILSP